MNRYTGMHLSTTTSHAFLPDYSATPNMGEPIGLTVNGNVHRDLRNLNLYAWLLEPRVSGIKVSLAKWQRELRFRGGALPDQCMKHSDPFSSIGATTTRWTEVPP